jgi:N-acetylglutamate synthase-like GNAT family acetyltransferase
MATKPVDSGAIRPLAPADRQRLADLLRAGWGSTRMVSRGRLFEVAELPGFVAARDADWLGYTAYDIRGDALEIAVLESIVPGVGAGSALIAACVGVAQARDLGRVWLVTTNDNLDALHFYQRRGFRLTALHPDAVTRARESVKPEIGLIGDADIPIRDELELDLPRADWQTVMERDGWPAI